MLVSQTVGMQNSDCCDTAITFIRISVVEKALLWLVQQRRSRSFRDEFSREMRICYVKGFEKESHCLAGGEKEAE